MAWRIFNRFWSDDYSSLDGDSDGQAAYVNLHTWKTEEPIKPHYHFHCLIPNYRKVVDTLMEDEEGNPTYRLEKKPWHKQRGGTEVHFGDEVLGELKKRRCKRLLKFARRHGIKCSVLEDKGVVDVYVNFVSLDGGLGKAKVMNRINYQSRHPIEDYAVYSNKHPSCPDPPDWLLHYENRTRVFGWWRYISRLTEGADMSDKEKLSPLDGEPMEYMGTISLEGLLARGQGKLGYLDIVKGKPVVGELTEADIGWLRSVMWHPLVGGTR
jgi:hypothetical protein